MLNIMSPAQLLKDEGVACYRRGDYVRAAEVLRRAAAQLPRDVGAWDLLGLALMRVGAQDEAVNILAYAAGIQDDALVLNNLGVALMQSGRFAEALEPLQKAYRLSPGTPGTRHNLAKVLVKRGQIGEALGHLDALLAQKPDDADLHLTRGIALSSGGRSAAAVAELRRSLALQPTGQGLDHLLMALHESGAEPADILAAARQMNVLFKPDATFGSFANERVPEKRLRIGYLSADFCLHPVATFFEPLLAQHDRTRIELFCYASVRRPDEVTARLRQLAGAEWREVLRMKDADVAGQMRRDGIDILVELGGHTPGNRLGVAAYKPAPIVVTHLGYPSTTGLAAVNYRLTDEAVDTPEAGGWYSERLVRLGGPFAVYQPMPEPPAQGGLAEGGGKGLPMLTKGHCTLGVFASRGKISAPVLEAWGTILQRLPAARLRVYVMDPGDAAAQVQGALSAGGTAERVEVLQRLPVPAYIAAHNEIDIMLDTFPLSGHTTVCHALWMGVPAICLEGRMCWERLGASVMREVGLGEWVARTRQEYVEQAVRLAGDPERLSALRAALRNWMQKSRLMDHAGHAAEVEAAYRGMWREWCAGAR